MRTPRRDEADVVQRWRRQQILGHAGLALLGNVFALFLVENVVHLLFLLGAFALYMAVMVASIRRADPPGGLVRRRRGWQGAGSRDPSGR